MQQAEILDSDKSNDELVAVSSDIVSDIADDLELELLRQPNESDESFFSAFWTDPLGGVAYAFAFVDDRKLGVKYFEYVAPLQGGLDAISAAIARHIATHSDDSLLAALNADSQPDARALARAAIGWRGGANDSIIGCITRVLSHEDPKVAFLGVFASFRLGWSCLVPTLEAALATAQDQWLKGKIDEVIEWIQNKEAIIKEMRSAEGR